MEQHSSGVVGSRRKGTKNIYKVGGGGTYISPLLLTDGKPPQVGGPRVEVYRTRL